ncbi:MAG: PQQ-dependent sugar dehydrogenase [Caldilinea sp.]
MLVALLLAACTGAARPAPRPTAPTALAVDLILPSGFTAEVVVNSLNGPTQMIAGPDGRLWVAQLNGSENAGTGQVLSINLETGDRRVQLDDLYKPTGIAAHNARLWIASGRDLLAAPIGADASVGPPGPVLTDLPFNGRSNGTLTVTPHGEIVCETSGRRLGNEAVPGSASLWALTPQDPTNPRALATGLKGAYSHTVDAQGRIWTTEIGDDPIDEGFPPEELNLVVVGADFGWPQCAGDRQPVQRYGGTPERCAETRQPVALFPPGVTPTSVASAPWDEAILLVALWNTGEIVQVKVSFEGDNAVGELSSFLTGLRNPQHLLAWRDGSLYVSDFATGSIYQITKNES